MPIKIVDILLPTTMVGPFPRPGWYNYELLGRNIRVAFKEAGLDIVTDGQMSYDDYVGVIGSFCWYMYERIPGFQDAKETHPSEIGAAVRTKEIELLADWGGVVNDGPVSGGPIRLADLYKIGKKYARRPMKVSVGAGPINLAWHVHFQHYKDARELSFALAPIFNAEMKELVAAGATYLQLEDLGAWLPVFTKDENDYAWIGDVVAECLDGVGAKVAWHFCFGNAWGNAVVSSNYATVRPHFYDAPVDQFVLDFANRDMSDIDCLNSLPQDKEVQIGVIDIRTMMIETPEQVADRIRRVIKVVPAERVYLSTDCGMKPLPGIVAKMKLEALVAGAKIVREELNGK